MTRPLVHVMLFVALTSMLAGSAVVLHRSMADGNTPVARRFRDFYLRTDPSTGKPVNAALIDLFIPCLLFGLTAGLLLWRWRRMLFGAWAAVSVLTAVLRVVYDGSIHYPA